MPEMWVTGEMDPVSFQVMETELTTAGKKEEHLRLNMSKDSGLLRRALPMLPHLILSAML